MRGAALARRVSSWVPVAVAVVTVAVPAAAASRPSIIRRVEIAAPQVAITFDACATLDHGYGFDRGIYDVLRREQIPATVFVSGRWVELHPGEMQELADDPLVEFANHSYAHPHMTRLPAGDIAGEIDMTEAALARYGKRSVAFRPPFGEYSARVLDVARQRRLPPVLWDVVSGDPSASMTTAAMIRTVVRKTRPGSIVIFHINGRGTKTSEALPVILAELRQRGFGFVHLSQLLAEGATAGDRIVAAALPPSAPARLVTAPDLAKVEDEAPLEPACLCTPRPASDAAFGLCDRPETQICP
jgi:peptidoglycan-N-acetylglucosamine deacetylase